MGATQMRREVNGSKNAGGMSLEKYRDLIDRAVQMRNDYMACATPNERVAWLERARTMTIELFGATCNRATERDRLRFDYAAKQIRVLVGDLDTDAAANQSPPVAASSLVADLSRSLRDMLYIVLDDLTHERQEALSPEIMSAKSALERAKRGDPLEATLRRMLNPEDLGFALTAHARDEVRAALGQPRCEQATRN